MPDRNSYYRERASRARTGRREEPQGDSLTICLTIQLIVVLLLILTVWILKQNNPQGYEDFQKRYHTMINDPDSFDGGFLETLEAYWGKVEEIVHGLPFVKKPMEDVPPQTDTVIDVPEEDIQAFDYGYDYLQPENTAYAMAPGGVLQVAMAGAEFSNQLAAPNNAVLSPVMLSAPVKPPVTGAVTSPFAWRYHPITQASDFHTGLDIAAEEGRAILAALPGEVVEIGESKIYGNYIVLQHATNLQTSYSHCSEIIAREGMSVKQGERIAKVGQTGTATGPHLHFSVIVEGVFTDPCWVLEDSIELVN